MYVNIIMYAYIYVSFKYVCAQVYHCTYTHANM